MLQGFQAMAEMYYGEGKMKTFSMEEIKQQLQLIDQACITNAGDIIRQLLLEIDKCEKEKLEALIALDIKTISAESYKMTINELLEEIELLERDYV